MGEDSEWDEQKKKKKHPEFFVSICLARFRSTTFFLLFLLYIVYTLVYCIMYILLCSSTAVIGIECTTI